MLFCGGFSHFHEVAGAKKCTKAHAEPRESVGSALLAVDDADGRPDDESLVTES